MVRYIMSVKVPFEKLQETRKVINRYFYDLEKNGPGGMRSQCYASNDDHCCIIHIKSFRKESVAHHHFRSAIFRGYMQELHQLTGQTVTFSKLNQQKTFESIY